MTLPTYQEGIAAFLSLFRQTAPYKHRYEVFQDFVTMAACALHNGLHKDSAREDEYLKIIGSYKSEDQKRFPELLGILVQLLEHEPRDVLGELYMQLELGSREQGQFFTPQPVSEMMAHLVLDEPVRLMQTREFITLSEPACGAGGMALALVKTMIAQQLNPVEKLWVQCVDVHRMAALMCYIQLTLWHVPAQVIVGNTLTLETREVWYTPAHHLGLWNTKLRQQRLDERSEAAATVPPQAAPAQGTNPEPESPTVIVDQFDLTVNAEQMGFEF